VLGPAVGHFRGRHRRAIRRLTVGLTTRGRTQRPYDDFVPNTWPGRALAATYVLAVVILASIAWGHDHGGFDPIEAAALVLALPIVVPALPIIYVVGAIAWNATGAPDNGPMWPVALTFAVLLGACACINVWLLHTWTTRRTSCREGSAATRSAA
jgi:hypothetical protein